MIFKDLKSVVKVYEPVEITIKDYSMISPEPYGVYRTLQETGKDLDMLDVVSIESIVNIETKREDLPHGLLVVLQDPIDTIHSSHPIYTVYITKNDNMKNSDKNTYCFIHLTEICDTCDFHLSTSGWVSRQYTYSVEVNTESAQVISRIISVLSGDGRFMENPYLSIRSQGDLLEAEYEIGSYIYEYINKMKIDDMPKRFSLMRSPDSGKVVEVYDNDDDQI